MTNRIAIHRIIDWYDGIVVATARADWETGLFLLSLLGWDQGNDQRVFAMVPVEASIVTSLLDAIDVDWSLLKLRLRDALRPVEQRVTVLRLRGSTNELAAKIEVPFSEVERDLFRDIQQILDLERNDWLTRV